MLRFINCVGAIALLGCSGGEPDPFNEKLETFNKLAAKVGGEISVRAALENGARGMPATDSRSGDCELSTDGEMEVELSLGGDEFTVDAGTQFWSYDATCGEQVRANIDVFVVRRGELPGDGFDISYRGDVTIDEQAKDVCKLSASGTLDGDGHRVEFNGMYCERDISTFDFELFTPPIRWW